MEQEIAKQARYVAKLVQGSQALECAALDISGYARLYEVARQHIREKWSEQMQELIKKWTATAESLFDAASMTDQLRIQRYGNYYRRLDKQQRREFQRLQSEAIDLRNQARVFRKCADELTAVFTTRA